MTPTSSLTAPGAFVVGCNYWASHAGTQMWRDWRPEVVAANLDQLAAAGLEVLRVFPLWPDFQPLTLLRTGHGRPREYRLGEAPLPPGEVGQAGVAEVMLQRFGEFADLAQARGLKLMVGLITGWMSGRLFVPPALEGLNVLTDPVAIFWQVRFTRVFVRRFRGHPAIVAWDLGNECNCMASVPSREAAWNWTAAIAHAIRVEDPTLPVVSGMHSLQPAAAAHWRMQDQGELTDLLTTHPYPIFTPHCDRDPVGTIRPLLHAAAESRFYADLGGRPCMAEELGTLGPMVCGEAEAARFIRRVLMQLWAHDCPGLLWWCAHDQDHLEHAPYDWHSYERELGLVRGDGSAKPVLGELGGFARWRRGLPFAALPAYRREAVCILTAEQDQWAVAYSSFILAKQAGFDLRFHYADEEPLPAAPLYLLPALHGAQSLNRRSWLALFERARAGATLYVSHHSAMLSPFTAPFGLEVVGRGRRQGPVTLRAEAGVDLPELSCANPFQLLLRPTHARVLAREADGNPALTEAALGQGRVVFLTAAPELELAGQPGTFHGPRAQAWWRLYAWLAAPLVAGRALRREHPLLGVTEHDLPDGRRVVVATNLATDTLHTRVTPAPGWHWERAWLDTLPAADGTLALADAAVWTLTPSAKPTP